MDQGVVHDDHLVVELLGGQGEPVAVAVHAREVALRSHAISEAAPRSQKASLVPVFLPDLNTMKRVPYIEDTLDLASRHLGGQHEGTLGGECLPDRGSVQSLQINSAPRLS